ncbi:acyltransferase family protein, partial [Angustibacter aerolatus]
MSQAPEQRRAPLDGLRAVAVTAVVVYHLGSGTGSVLPGGFLGVDLFFVLSGYLITGLLLAEHARTGRIALGAFWARRVRRLLPALLLVLLVVCAATWWAARPETWPARRADVLWTLGYAANWHFVAVGEDYFAAYAGASPLRHAWSLSIEEQFYAAWPLLVAVVLGLAARARRSDAGRRALGVVSVLLVAGSAAALALELDPRAPARAYYGTEGRVQELLVGALLTLVLPRLRRLPSWAGWLGAAGLVAGLGLGDDAAPAYYRGGALAFCVAVALVVAAVEQAPASALGRALSWRPAVALGRVSYGVYLWHWPVLVLLPQPGPPGEPRWWLVQAVRVLATLAAAGLSYRLVELPVQRGGVPWLRRSGRRTLAAGAAGIALVD